MFIKKRSKNLTQIQWRSGFVWEVKGKKELPSMSFGALLTKERLPRLHPDESFKAGSPILVHHLGKLLLLFPPATSSRISFLLLLFSQFPFSSRSSHCISPLVPFFFQLQPPLLLLPKVLSSSAFFSLNPHGWNPFFLLSLFPVFPPPENPAFLFPLMFFYLPDPPALLRL